MKKFFLIAISFISFGFANVVFASGNTQQESQAAAIEIPAFGDVEAGKNKAAACTACHGRNGNSAVSSYPKLAGQGAKYLYKQMKDFQSGARQDPIMGAQVAGRSDEDSKDMSASF